MNKLLITFTGKYFWRFGKMKVKNNDRIEIRLNGKDLLCLKATAFKAKMTVSEYMRMLVSTAILPIKKQIRQGELSYEDIETVFNDKLLQRRVSQREAGRTR